MVLDDGRRRPRIVVTSGVSAAVPASVCVERRAQAIEAALTRTGDARRGPHPDPRNEPLTMGEGLTVLRS